TVYIRPAVGGDVIVGDVACSCPDIQRCPAPARRERRSRGRNRNLPLLSNQVCSVKPPITQTAGGGISHRGVGVAGSLEIVFQEGGNGVVMRVLSWIGCSSEIGEAVADCLGRQRIVEGFQLVEQDIGVVSAEAEEVIAQDESQGLIVKVIVRIVLKAKAGIE